MQVRLYPPVSTAIRAIGKKKARSSSFVANDLLRETPAVKEHLEQPARQSKKRE